MADRLFKRHLAQVQDGAEAMRSGRADADSAYATHDAVLDLVARAEEVEAQGGARHADKVDRAEAWHDKVDDLMREMGLIPHRGRRESEAATAASSDAAVADVEPGLRQWR
jgi:hypothetical protein